MVLAAHSEAPLGPESGEALTRSDRPWDDPDEWPTPAWYQQAPAEQGIRTYERFVANELRTRYMELEGDFRTSVVYDGRELPTSSLGTVRRTFELLTMSRKVLEAPDPDPLIVAGTLNLVERYMVWLFKPALIPSRVATLLNRLEVARPSGWEWFTARLREVTQTAGPNDASLLATLDEAIGLYNQHRLAEHINRGLQLKRLKGLRTWGLIFLGVFLAASPFATHPSVMTEWPTIPHITERLGEWGLWVGAVGIGLVGAIGGFLSALMHAQDSRVSLTGYQESVLKLQIKPLVGAIVALVLFVLLSWKILPGVTIENLGSYFLIAFMSGFSERYFLKILDLDRSDPAAKAASAAAQPPALSGTAGGAPAPLVPMPTAPSYRPPPR